MTILLVFHILYISDFLIMPHNYDVAMDTGGDHVRFTWILYVYYVYVHINIFVYTFRYGYPKKLNWLPWKRKI